MNVKNHFIFLIVILFFTHISDASPLSLAGEILSITENLISITTGLSDKNFKEDLKEIENTQLSEIMGDIHGTIKTVQEANRFNDENRRLDLFRESLIHLNQSIEKNYRILENFLDKDYSIRNLSNIFGDSAEVRIVRFTATITLVDSFCELCLLKIIVLKELKENHIAEDFYSSAEFKQKTNNINNKLSVIVNELNSFLIEVIGEDISQVKKMACNHLNKEMQRIKNQ